MTTTDYFIQDSLVLDWVWERVKVDRIIDKNIQILDTIPKCWMAWAISAIWPFIFLLGKIKESRYLSVWSFLTFPARTDGSELLHGPGDSPRGESPPGEIQQTGSQRNQRGKKAKKIQISLPGGFYPSHRDGAGFYCCVGL